MLPLQFIDEDGFIQQQNPFTGEWEIVSPEPARISYLAGLIAAVVAWVGKGWP